LIEKCQSLYKERPCTEIKNLLKVSTDEAVVVSLCNKGAFDYEILGFRGTEYFLLIWTIWSNSLKIPSTY